MALEGVEDLVSDMLILLPCRLVLPAFDPSACTGSVHIFVRPFSILRSRLLGLALIQGQILTAMGEIIEITQV